MNKINKPLFKIDFNKWKLLKNPETGLLIDPVPMDDFDKFQYWSNLFKEPIRQIICKKEASLYADYLNLDSATLYRRASLTLGFSAYDDEITKEEYEELCQTALLKHHYNKHINYEILLPFQTLALTFLRFQEKVLILKLKELYKVNTQKRLLEKTSLFSEDILAQCEKISEHEFYYYIIQELIKKDGMEFLNN